MNEFVAVVSEDGKRILFDFPKAWEAYRKRFAGDEVVVTLKKRRAQRSNPQNRFWHGVIVTLLAEHCGYTHDEMHEALKVKFLGTEDMSRGLLRIGSTRKLNTLEFAELTERVMLWAIEELGVVIPSPEREPAKRKRAA